MNWNDIHIVTKKFGFIIEKWNPGNRAKYSVWKNYSQLSDWMTFKNLCAWLQGYEAAHEAKQSQ